VQRASEVADAIQTPGAEPEPSIGYAVQPQHGPVLTQLHVPAQAAERPLRAVEGWDLGPFTHVRDLQLGSAVARLGFRFQARGGHIGDLLYANQYSDDFTGISGDGPGSDPMIAHFILSGWARFENETTAVTVKPGQVVFRDTAKPWRFWFGPGTKSRILTVPRQQVVHHPGLTGKPPAIVVADASLAEARLLDSYLDLARGLGREPLSSLGRDAGQEAGVHLLLAAVGAASAADAAGYLNVTLAAARKFIDGHLEEPNLAPQLIAGALHMSVRTLHRAFGDADDSVMAYVRRQRLRRARAQLMDSGARVADVAARWQFSDTSHFIRQFKAVYGVTPTTFMREEHKLAKDNPETRDGTPQAPRKS